MEWADEPILLTGLGLGTYEVPKAVVWGWVAGEKVRDEASGGEARGSLVDHVKEIN